MIKKMLLSISLVVYVLSATGCGVILYPERQGQKSGKIDLAVAALDGIGLLIFIVPGLVAFAVDFHQGTIYLPNSRAAIDAGGPDYIEVKVEGPMTVDSIEAVLLRELELPINLDDERAFAYEINSIDSQSISTLAFIAKTAKG